jgi:hypothetical protein
MGLGPSKKKNTNRILKRWAQKDELFEQKKAPDVKLVITIVVYRCFLYLVYSHDYWIRDWSRYP